MEKYEEILDITKNDILTTASTMSDDFINKEDRKNLSDVIYGYQKLIQNKLYDHGYDRQFVDRLVNDVLGENIDYIIKSIKHQSEKT